MHKRLALIRLLPFNIMRWKLNLIRPSVHKMAKQTLNMLQPLLQMCVRPYWTLEIIGFIKFGWMFRFSDALADEQ